MSLLLGWKGLANALNCSVSTAKRIVEVDPNAPTKINISDNRVAFLERQIEAYVTFLLLRQRELNAEYVDHRLKAEVLAILHEGRAPDPPEAATAA